MTHNMTTLARLRLARAYSALLPLAVADIGKGCSR